jgi:peptide subunit release factor 1 (eRF1)
VRALAAFRADSGDGVLSLYLDLDPSEFAVPKARTAEIESLADEARQRYTDDEEHRPLELDSPVARTTERARAYLEQEFAPRRALGVALFAAEQPDLFVVIRLHYTVKARVVLARRPFVRPLLEGPPALDGWALLMVNRRTARLLAGRGGVLEEVQQFADDVHRRHDQGGLSQPRYQGHIEKQVKDHVQHACQALFDYSREGRVEHLVVSATEEVGPLVEESLHPELARVLRGRITADIEAARPDEIAGRVMELAVLDREQTDRDLIDQLGAGLGNQEGAVAGTQQVLEALNQRAVGVLLACPDLSGAAAVCPSCGWLGLEAGVCPIDGSWMEMYDDQLEAMVEAALDQAAGVRLLDRQEVRSHGCAAALLRFDPGLGARSEV